MTRFAAILCAAGLLAGCATDPLQGVPRLSETDVSEADIQAAIRAEPEEAIVTEPEPQRRGLFAGLFGSAPDAEPATPVVEAPVTAIDAAASDPGASADATATPEPPRRGLLGFLQRAADEALAPEREQVELAALPPTENDTATTSGGLFGGRANPQRADDPDFPTVALGTRLPFGTLARVCDVRPRQLGRRIERYPENRGVYQLFDSDPGETAPHTFYVTGFKDGCARQFTAAMALFGSTQTHEQLRYGLPAQVQPYSTTDAAYERLKSRICRVGRGKPCGAALPRLARNTVFVSVYERFGSNPTWKTILIHDGEVVETDIRGN